MRWANGPAWVRWLDWLIWKIGARKRFPDSVRMLSGWWAALHIRLPRRGLCRECTSGWYIFEDTSGGLAVWANCSLDLPTFPFEAVKDIVHNDQWWRIPGFEQLGDQGVLRDALVDYLREKAR